MEIFTEIGTNIDIKQNLNPGDLVLVKFPNIINPKIYLVSEAKHFLNNIFYGEQEYLHNQFLNRADSVKKYNFRFIVSSIDCWFIKNTEVFPLEIIDENHIKCIGYTIKDYTARIDKIFLPAIDIQQCNLNEFNISKR